MGPLAAGWSFDTCTREGHFIHKPWQEPLGLLLLLILLLIIMAGWSNLFWGILICLSEVSKLMFGGVIWDDGRAGPDLSSLTQDSADVTVFSLVVFASSLKSEADLVFSFSPWSVSVLSGSGVMSWAADFPSFHAWEGLEWCQADFQLGVESDLASVSICFSRAS